MNVFMALLFLALIGAPLFVIVGAVTGVAYVDYTDTIRGFESLGTLIDPLEDLLGKDAFLAIPLFIASGAIMTAGGLAKRLVEVAKASLSWMPGGLGIAAVVSCMVFAAISGSSPVTLIAVGSIMYPAMVKAKYPDNFSLGLVMTAGSLGCLMVPALVLLIYAIAVSSVTKGSVDPSDMFIASIIPAMLVAIMLSVYSYLVGRKLPGARPKFESAELIAAIRDGVWGLLLPVIVIGGILGGFLTPFKAGAVAVVYALIVTMFIYRELTLPKAIQALADAGKLMGMLILVIALAFSFNNFLALVGVEAAIVALIDDWGLGPIGFMLLVNVVLIVLGALMDSISATLIFAPILAPIAVSQYGIDPLHFGVVFVVNMEIGYLAPPVATNLFIAAALFRKPFEQVCRAVLPGLAITCAALVLLIYVPTLSKGLVNYTRGQDIWESFPWDGKPSEQAESSAPTYDLDELSEKASEEADAEGDLNEQSDDEYYFKKGGDAGADDSGDSDDLDDDSDLDVDLNELINQ